MLLVNVLKYRFLTAMKFSNTFLQSCMSKDVIPDVLSTHLFRRSRAPVRCKTCENYVYLKGSECQKCGIVCHRKCLKSLSIKCAGHPLPHKVGKTLGMINGGTVNRGLTVT